MLFSLLNNETSRFYFYRVLSPSDKNNRNKTSWFRILICNKLLIYWCEKSGFQNTNRNIVSAVLKQVFIWNDATLSSALCYARIRIVRISKKKKNILSLYFNLVKAVLSWKSKSTIMWLCHKYCITGIIYNRHHDEHKYKIETLKNLKIGLLFRSENLKNNESLNDFFLAQKLEFVRGKERKGGEYPSTKKIV